MNMICKTLSFQACSNFRVISLENLNFHKFVNTGRVLLSDDISYFTSAIKTSKDILWKGKNIYKIPLIDDIKNQFYTIMSFCDNSRQLDIEFIKKQIKIIEKEEDIKNSTNEEMRIFISYTSVDSKLQIALKVYLTAITYQQ